MKNISYFPSDATSDPIADIDNGLYALALLDEFRLKLMVQDAMLLAITTIGIMLLLLFTAISILPFL